MGGERRRRQPSRERSDPGEPPDARPNVVVLRGTVTSGPERRTLADGRTVVQLDVTTAHVGPDGRADRRAVPVSWSDPAESSLAPIAVGVEVVVVGSVRRRFFRAGGATRSRTEVDVEVLEPARRAARVRRAVLAVAGSLTASVTPAGAGRGP